MTHVTFEARFPPTQDYSRSSDEGGEVRRPYDPAGPAVGLTIFTWLYLLWWFLPIALLVQASLADDAAQPIGLSLRWYREALDDETYRASLRHSLWLSACTVGIALPLGVTTALGLSRWRRRLGNVGTGMVVVAIATPQITFATALFLLFTSVPQLRLGATAQVIGHVTLALPFAIVIVWAALVSIPRDQEESAMDLGATTTSAILRVVLPQILPALAAAGVVAWFLSFDNLVLSTWLCVANDCVTFPMQLYGRGGVRGSPVLYAYGSVGLLLTVLLAAAVLPSIARLLGGRRRVTGRTSA